MNFLNSLFLYAYMFVIFDRSPFEVEDSVKVSCLLDPFVDPISVVLRRLGNEELCCGSLVKTVGRLKLAGHVIQYKSHVTKKFFTLLNLLNVMKNSRCLVMYYSL